MAGIETVNAMSVQDTTTGAGRSVLGDVLHWVGVRFAGYLLVMFGSVLAFFIWATFYTYVLARQAADLDRGNCAHAC